MGKDLFFNNVIFLLWTFCLKHSYDFFDSTFILFSIQIYGLSGSSIREAAQGIDAICKKETVETAIDDANSKKTIMGLTPGQVDRSYCWRVAWFFAYVLIAERYVYVSQQSYLGVFGDFLLISNWPNEPAHTTPTHTTPAHTTPAHTTPLWVIGKNSGSLQLHSNSNVRRCMHIFKTIKQFFLYFHSQLRPCHVLIYDTILFHAFLLCSTSILMHLH